MAAADDRVTMADILTAGSFDRDCICPVQQRLSRNRSAHDVVVLHRHEVVCGQGR